MWYHRMHPPNPWVGRKRQLSRHNRRVCTMVRLLRRSASCHNLASASICSDLAFPSTRVELPVSAATTVTTKTLPSTPLTNPTSSLRAAITRTHPSAARPSLQRCLAQRIPRSDSSLQAVERSQRPGRTIQSRQGHTVHHVYIQPADSAASVRVGVEPPHRHALSSDPRLLSAKGRHSHVPRQS